MKEQRHISLTVVFENEYDVFFKVSNTHRGKDFVENGNSFIAKNGIKLASVDYPSISNFNVKTIFVQGFMTKLDGMILKASTEMFKFYQEAVEEYNYHYSDLPEIVFFSSIKGTHEKNDYINKFYNKWNTFDSKSRLCKVFEDFVKKNFLTNNLITIKKIVIKDYKAEALIYYGSSDSRIIVTAALNDTDDVIEYDAHYKPIY